jgi:[ribosomal protein S5]-alanine N-acetyltransferase
MKIEVCPGLYIREIIEKDKYSIVKDADNKKISKNLRDTFPFPYTVKDAENWLVVLNNNISKRSFAIANEEELIGAIGIEPCKDVNRFSGELGYWLGEPFWGKGVTTLVVKEFIKYVFEFYDLIKIFAYVFSSNPSSGKVLVKAGFKLEGCMRNQIVKDVKILDQLVYGIIKKEVPGLRFKRP